MFRKIIMILIGLIVHRYRNGDVGKCYLIDFDYKLSTNKRMLSLPHDNDTSVVRWVRGYFFIIELLLCVTMLYGLFFAVIRRFTKTLVLTVLIREYAGSVKVCIND